MQQSPIRLLIAFLIALVVFIGTGIQDYRAVTELIQAQGNRVSQRLIAIELQNLTSLATMAETGQRGYVITGREEYLAPFYEAREKFPASISMLRDNLSRDPEELQRLGEVERVYGLKLAELEQSIEVRRQSGFSAAQALVLTDQGKTLMDEMRQHVFAMQQIEQAKLNARIEQSEASAQQAMRSILIAGALDATLLILLFLLVRADVKRKEAAAQERADAATLLRNVIDGSPAPIYLKDRSGHFLMFNKTYEKIFGAVHGSQSRMSDYSPFDENDPAGPSVADIRVLQSGELVQFEEEIDTAEGKKYFFVSKAPLRTHEGSVIGICAVAADVSPLKEAESQVRLLNRTLEKRVEERTGELAQVNARLQEANEQLEAFSYTVAHDLRAPLRGIQGFSDAVVEDYAEILDQSGRDYLQRISRATARMEQLIEDLLSFSRLSRMELPPGNVNLDEVFEDVMMNLRIPIQETGTTITVAPNLSSVRANRAACVHIFQNLVSNAIKFARLDTPSSVRVWSEIRNTEQAEPSFVRVWVEDNGIGIAETQLQRIFRPFERLHGIDEYAGSGVGLAVVDKSVRRMNGRYGVESTEGMGSRFWVELPAVYMEK